MQLKDFDFPFDERLIATQPADPRHSAKLLHVHGADIIHRKMLDFADMLQDGDCLVINNTKVIKARLYGHLTSPGKSASIEATLHKYIAYENDKVIYSAFVRGAKKLKAGDTLSFDGLEGSLSAEVTDKNPVTGEVIFAFQAKIEDFEIFLDQAGTMPLPPYIASKRAADRSDEENYQAIFAKYPGSVAAPTASLHFDDILLEKIQRKNITFAEVTLHISGGTFLPVKTEDIHDHIMHSEKAILTEQTADMINRTKEQGHRIIAIGTTALRTIESAATPDRRVIPYEEETNLFITPGYDIKIADLLLTNFHLPKSTLFMLVCAFAGTDIIQKAYNIAQQENYRFFSYGDACLLHKGCGG
ncbi:MAG: tRNA preQ1(34) S-adenosylmethionine ribosyltransferase-isomerase QueA [Pseudomonadota bacterium]